MPHPLVIEWSQRILQRLGVRETPTRTSARSMLSFAMSFVTVEQVEGDYLEFGVFQGNSFINAWREIRINGRTSTRLYAFDSFAGLPDPNTSHVDSGGEFSAGQYQCSRPAFEKNLRDAKVDMRRVDIIEGFYEETLENRRPKEFGIERAAVVWIDCDLYESARICLEFVSDALVDGSVLIFDDWYCFRAYADRGEQRACAEWLAQHPEFELVPYRDFHWAGRSFIVHRSG